jgi:hypothetical protein
MDEKVKVKERVATPEELRSINEALRLPAVAEQTTFPLQTKISEAREQTPAVGQRATRPDGRLHGLGQTKYIDDMFLPGLIHA